VGVVGVGGWGWFPLAFEHSKVCTLCDFGHLQFLLYRKTRFCFVILPDTKVDCAAKKDCSFHGCVNQK
jgi:hypothetical protein